MSQSVKHSKKVILLTALILLFGLESCSNKVIVYSPVGGDITCRAPEFLRPGDKVALLSPAYYCDTAAVRQAAEIIKSWGYEPVVGEHAALTFMGKYAGTDEQRLADLRQALTDPDIKAIICNRGGFGTLHFVDVLPLDIMSSNPKWLVGYSDITTLHAMEVSSGTMSIHGIMGGGLASCNGEGAPAHLLRDMLRGIMPRYIVPPHPCNQKGTGRGILVGGNICTFSPLACTSVDFTAYDDIILFIEEVDEPYRNIDRLFNMLVKRGVLEHCRGVVLGDFSGCGGDLTYGSVEEMLHHYLKEYKIPVLCGFPAGHGKVNLPLPMGAETTITVNADGGTLSFNIGTEVHDFYTSDTTTAVEQ